MEAPAIIRNTRGHRHSEGLKRRRRLEEEKNGGFVREENISLWACQPPQCPLLRQMKTRGSRTASAGPHGHRVCFLRWAVPEVPLPFISNS